MNSHPKCPFCRHAFTDQEIWYSGYFPTETSGDQNTFGCPSCGTPLTADLDLQPQWQFIDEDGEELLPTPPTEGDAT